jgi:hypothetical protein
MVRLWMVIVTFSDLFIFYRDYHTGNTFESVLSDTWHTGNTFESVLSDTWHTGSTFESVLSDTWHTGSTNIIKNAYMQI